MWSYFGGKFLQAPWIEAQIPSDFKTYVEPFGGGFWVYLKSQLGVNVIAYPDLERVVYNDLNKNNVNAWRCMVKYPEEMLRLIKGMHLDAWDPEVFKRFMVDLNVPKTDGIENLMNEFELGEPDCQRALKYIFALCVTFSGASMTQTRTVIPRGKEKQFHAVGNRLQNNHYRLKLKAITDVECMDYKDLIAQYDSTDTFIYLDPPYFGGVAQYNSDSFGSRGKVVVDEHERLAKILQNTLSRWILSYYHFDLLEEWLPRHKYRWLEKEYNKGGQGKVTHSPKVKAKEILIMNY